MKRLFNYLLYISYAVLLAAGYGYVTYIIIYPMVVDGRVLIAHVVNFSFIIFMLFSDKLEYYLLQRKKYTVKKSVFAKIYRALSLGHVSYRASVYLFYLFILVLSIISHSGAYIAFSDNFQNYLHIIDYGILFLIAADMFIKQLSVDIKRVNDMDDDAEKEQAK